MSWWTLNPWAINFWHELQIVDVVKHGGDKDLDGIRVHLKVAIGVQETTQGLGAEAKITSENMEGIHEELHEDPVWAEFQARVARDTENEQTVVGFNNVATKQLPNSRMLSLCIGVSIAASAFGFLMHQG